MFKFALLLFAYTTVALLMCAFIMANDSGESLGSPSPISEVKSTQRGSIVEYIIWGLAVAFIALCIVLGRSSRPSVITRLLKQDTQTQAVVDREQEPNQLTSGLVIDSASKDLSKPAEVIINKESIPQSSEPVTDVTDSIIQQIIKTAS